MRNVTDKERIENIKFLLHLAGSMTENMIGLYIKNVSEEYGKGKVDFKQFALSCQMPLMKHLLKTKTVDEILEVFKKELNPIKEVSLN